MTTPDPYMQRHREDALVENVLFLRDTCGLHRDQIANRVGIKWDAIEKILERRVERERQCPTPGCGGDVRYAAPGRGHREGCRHPYME